MELGLKLKLIREMRGLGQAELADKLNYSKSYVNHIESRRRIVSDEALVLFKEALQIEDVPLTTVELEAFKKELNDWQFNILNRERAIATKMFEDLGPRAAMSLCPDTKTHFDLLSASYFYLVARPSDFEQVLVDLADKIDDCPDDHRLVYYFESGRYNTYLGQHKDALSDFIRAKNIGETLARTDISILEMVYYSLVVCNTNLDYAYEAIEYIELAKSEFLKKNNYAYRVTLNIWLAINYSKIGRHNEAISLLDICVREEVGRETDLNLGWTHHWVAKVHLQAGNFDLAVKYADTAHDYFEKGLGEPMTRDNMWVQMMENLYNKTVALLKAGSTDLAWECFDEWITIIPETSLAFLLFQALKNSHNLAQSECLAYMEDIAIPQLLEHGRHLLVIGYCELLCAHFENVKQRKRALHYSKKALGLQRQLFLGPGHQKLLHQVKI